MPDESQTEAPSERRLTKATEEGNIAVSRDLTNWGSFAGALIIFRYQGPLLQQQVISMLRTVADGADRQPWAALRNQAWPVAARAMGICAGIALVALAVGSAQTRGGFWPELAGPKFDRLISGGGLRRIFKGEIFVDIGISVVKVLAIGIAIWTAVHDDFLTLLRLPGAEVVIEFHKSWGLLVDATERSLFVFAIFAGTDFALTRRRHRAKLKMSKEELKRESKEDEGDPLIRSRRRRKHRELAKAHARVAVPRADALIVNPTHVAIAIRYRRGTDRAPRVTAKGKGVLAEHMRELARENGIPIVEDIALARLLFRRVKIGGEVPAHTFQAVAAILAFVYRITGNAAARNVAPKPTAALKPNPAAKPMPAKAQPVAGSSAAASTRGVS